ncbi:MAG: hypothetical protein JSW67_02705 [Candidatus Latescibacterota bacterium]|nr:MAG: hypothetical protein JSW67_02705 [Candidatus Latescibacterota bacterium]
MRALVYALLIALALALGVAGCLFSSTRPETQEPTPPEEQIADDEVLLTGLVRVRDGTRLRAAPGWWIGLKWFGVDPKGTGEALLVEREIPAGADGVYSIRIRHKDVRRVEVRPERCDYDPTAPIWECCVDLTNPCGACPPRWEKPRSVPVVLGAHTQVDCVVTCVERPDS